MKEDEKKFLRTGEEPIKAIIPAAGDDSCIDSLRELLQDRPLTMLDINGKPLLQRIIDQLTRRGITDINVITGYKSDKINVENIKVIDNKEYAKKGILHSIMSAKDILVGRTLVTFSDVLFDEDLIEKVIRCAKGDINLVIDSSYKDTPFSKKKNDLVVAKYNPTEGHRVIKHERSNPILKTTKSKVKDSANYEFMGMVLFSKNGTEIIKKEYEALLKNPPKGTFYDAESFEKADITDFFQYLVDKGIKIDSVEVHKGWAEIRTFDDYKRACEMLSD